MTENFLGLYFIIIIIIALIAYAGLEETFKLINYLDLRWRYFIIQIQKEIMKKKLEKQLNLPQKKWEKRNNGK